MRVFITFILAVALLWRATARQLAQSSSPALVVYEPSSKCQTGWTGPGCELCTSDEVCQSSTGSEGATCTRAFEFGPSSTAATRKHYQCAVAESGLLTTFLVPGSITMTCGDGAAGDGDGPTCLVGMVVNGTGDQVSCQSSGCSIAGGSDRVYCETVACGCLGGGSCPSGFVSAFIRGVTGPMEVTCDPSSVGSPSGAYTMGDGAGSCTLAITGLPVTRIGLTCLTGQCLEGDSAPVSTSGSPSVPSIGAASVPICEPLIAAIPLLALACLTLFIGIYTWMAGDVLRAKVPGETAWGDTPGLGDPWKPDRDAATAPGMAEGGPLSRASLVSTIPPILVTPAAVKRRFSLKPLLSQGSGVEVRGAEGCSDAPTPPGIQLASSSCPPPCPGATAEPSTPTAQMMKNANLVHELTFKSLRVSVPLSRRKAAARRLAVVARALGHASGPRRPDRTPSAPVRPPGLGHGTDELDEAAEYLAGLHADESEGLGRWTVLSSVNGTLRAGELTGLLGPSGGGKTTLLGALAGAASELGGGARVRGEVLVDGEARSPTDVAFVPQADSLLPTLTARECVHYSAALRLPRGTPGRAIRARVAGALSELGLRAVADSPVGGLGGPRGLSGGERRRVAIAMELVIDPRILLLDEPTSGLDSYAASMVLGTLRGLARGGRVVLASLHAPSRDDFAAFDGVILMSHGRVLYDGPPTGAEDLFHLTENWRHEGTPPPGAGDEAFDVSNLAELAGSAVALDSAGGGPRGRVALGAGPAPAPTSDGSDSPRDLKGTVSCRWAGPHPTRSRDEPALPERLLALASDPVATRRVLAVRDREQREREEAEFRAEVRDRVGGALGGCAPITDSPRASESSSSGSAPLPEAEGAGGSGLRRSPGAPETRVPHDGDPSRPSCASSLAAPRDPSSRSGARPRRQTPGLSLQLAAMMRRTLTDIWRSPTLLRMHAAVAVAAGVVLGAMYWRVDDTNVGVQNRLGATFFVLAFLGFTSLTTTDLLLNERRTVIREVRSGYYKSGPYLLSKIVADAVLLRALPAVLLWAPFYHMAGFRGDAASSVTYALTLASFSCTVGAVSITVTTLVDTAGVASFVMNIFLLFSLAFAGFLVQISSIPGFLRWIHYLSIYFYAMEAMVSSQVALGSFSLDAAGYSSVQNVNGSTYLKTLGFSPSYASRDIAILVGLYGAFILAALLAFFARLPTTPGRRFRWNPAAAFTPRG